MAHLNGISRDVYNNNKLSNSDKEFVRNNYMNMSVHEMSDIIDKRAEYISNYARNNNIKVCKYKDSVVFYHYLHT